jgi:colicin import membrane protein
MEERTVFMNEFVQNHLAGMSRRDAMQWQSISLAVLVHGALLAFLWIGVQWQSSHPQAQDVEVWDLTYREAAPVAPVVPVVEPTPVEPTPVKPEPKVEVKEEPDPEIVLAQEKKRKALEEKKLAELEKKRLLEEQEKLKKEKLAEDKAKKEKLALEDANKKKLEAKEKAARDALHAERMQKITSQAQGGNGTAVKSTGNNRGDADYASKIAAKIWAKTQYTGIVPESSNPAADYKVFLFPDGTVRGSIEKIKSSGNLAFDIAVENAIKESAPFPRNSSGTVPTYILISQKMKKE